MDFNIPYLFISFQKNKDNNLIISEELHLEKSGFNISINPLCFDYYFNSNDDKEIIIIGSPIYNEKINFEEVSKLFLNSQNITEITKIINGQFLIILHNKKEKKLLLINDRFNGIHLYWADFKDHFVASFLYFDLFKYLRKKNNFKILGQSMLEFIWMSRVMGDKTYDNFSKYLLPASILEIGNFNYIISKYWRPNFLKKKRSTKQLGTKYIKLLVNSLKRLTSDNQNRRFGYFFSSGLDSRTVATAISFNKKKLTSYTVAFRENLEVKYARKAAIMAGSDHKFIKLDKNHLVKNLDANVRICSGMYSVHDALFTGLKETVQKNSDIVFHGHALDFWHYGNYLPTYFIKLFGSQTFLRRLMKIDDIVDLYFKYNPFRLTWTDKSLNLRDIIFPEFSEKSINLIKESILNDCKAGEDCCNNKIDQWEYIMLHAFGRHFTNINITSKLVSSKVRTPAFDNEIMDFQLSIPYKNKITDETRLYALNNIGPKIGSVPTANHGFNAGDSSLLKTIKLVVRKFKRILTRNMKYASPALRDRTWPNLNEYLRSNQDLLNEIQKVFKNDELKITLDMLDWEKIQKIYKEWHNGKNFDPIFWFSLISLSKFLEQTKK